MTLNRRTALAGFGASALALTAPSFAQRTPAPSAGALAATGATGATAAPRAEFSYKFANNLPATHPLNVRAREMATAVRAETRSRVDIQIFPGNQLGSDTDMLRMVRAGEIDFFTLSGLILSSSVPAAAITGMGFTFPNYDAVWGALDGDVGAHIRTQIAKETNLIAMDRIWDNGFRQITSNSKPINSAEDLRGMKIRVPLSPMWTSIFKALDTQPASINFAEVYPALMNKTVDGQENPLAVIDTAKLYEVQRFCSMTYHMWDGFWFLANRTSWEKLPLDLRGIVSKRINAAATVERVDVAILNAVLQKQLRDKGMVFNQPSPESFRNQMRKAGFYAEWKAKFGADVWAALERHTGKLG